MKRHTRRRESEYRSLITRKHERDLTYEQLAAESGVPISTLQYWARKLREENEPKPPVDVRRNTFVEVTIPAASEPSIEVVISGDLRVAVRPGFDPATLRAVVEALGC